MDVRSGIDEHDFGPVESQFAEIDELGFHAGAGIEMGARAGMVAPDDTTLEYIAAEDRPFAPKGQDFNRLAEHVRTLHTEPGATFDRHETLDASTLQPQVTWGTTPAMTVDIASAKCATLAL